MIKVTVAILSIVLFLFASDNAPNLTPILRLDARVQQNIYNDGNEDNVDQFFGRARFGMTGSIQNFTGTVAITAYPAGLGYEPLRGMEITETSGDVDLVNESEAKLQITSAYVIYSGNPFKITVGRSLLFNSNGVYFGNYIDEGPGGYFTGKGVYGNFVQINLPESIGSSSLTIGTSDPNINNGYFRFMQDIHPINNLHIGLGVRSDILNLVHSPDDTVHWNLSSVVDYNFSNSMKVYIEAAATGLTSDEEVKLPVLIGFQTPAGNFLDNIALEVELLNEEDRPVIEGVRQSPVLFGLLLEKTLVEHFCFEAGLYTVRELQEMAVGLNVKMQL